MNDKNILRLNLYLSVILIMMVLVTIALVYRMIVVTQNASKPVQVAEKNKEVELDIGVNAIADREPEEGTTTTYNQNYSTSVFSSLSDSAEIVIPIWAYNDYSNITINNKHEAYFNNEASNKKVAENVVNAWYCPLGQDIEAYGYIVFLKTDGSVSCVKLNANGTDVVDVADEQVLEGISNISNILVVEDGFYGVMFVKEDGTAMELPITELWDLTNPS